MDQRLGLVRAAYLNDFVTILRDVGVPVDRFLAQSSLPQNIEEIPQMQISTPTAVDWLAKVGNDINPMELGLLATSSSANSVNICSFRYQTPRSINWVNALRRPDTEN